MQWRGGQTSAAAGAGAPTAEAAAPAAPGMWSALRSGAFRTVWLGFFGSQLVLWMHGVGAATVIADLSDSAALVAMGQTALSLPSVLFALHAGAIADLVDRRRLLLATQTWMLMATGVLAVITFTDVVSAASALILTFCVGAGVAASLPAYQSLLPHLLDRQMIQAGVTLNGVAINLARVAGPAVAGLVVAAAGADWQFTLESVVIVLILSQVARVVPPPARRAERGRVSSAIGEGLRFARDSAAVRAVIVRVLLFVTGGSAFWALLPVLAFGPLGFSSRGLGLLVGAAGAGALAGTFALPMISRGSLDRLVSIGSAGLAVALAALALLEVPVVAAIACVVAGAAWLAILTSLNTASQIAAPDSVRARTLATFQLFFQGGLAFGSFVWGLVAEAAGVKTALLAAGASLVVGVVLAQRWRLVEEAHPDFATPVAPEPIR